LEVLPDELGGLFVLETLAVIHCRRLMGIPSSIGDLVYLKRLSLKGCSEVSPYVAFHDAIDMLAECRLEVINLSFCKVA